MGYIFALKRVLKRANYNIFIAAAVAAASAATAAVAVAVFFSEAVHVLFL